MTDKHVVTGRTSKGKFAKGSSGNPRGRPPMLSPELRERLDKATPEIIDKILEKALNGDLAAAKVILDRTAPIPKQSLATINIPGIDSSERSLSGKAELVLNSIATAECPPDVGISIIQALKGLSALKEFDEIEKRLTALEAK